METPVHASLSNTSIQVGLVSFLVPARFIQGFFCFSSESLAPHDYNDYQSILTSMLDRDNQWIEQGLEAIGLQSSSTSDVTLTHCCRHPNIVKEHPEFFASQMHYDSLLDIDFGTSLQAALESYDLQTGLLDALKTLLSQQTEHDFE